ncbi:hypothetical protein KIL84_015718 [Mauremys mutica]|uniref:Uncharacterized protein n=1 Tax=Mauremys mutica TaxID=74926 RepID=A0A9D4AS62_9SAUR|nr:hypothetical protein KIL84_015718 [Mauremys mutica]
MGVNSCHGESITLTLCRYCRNTDNLVMNTFHPSDRCSLKNIRTLFKSWNLSIIPHNTARHALMNQMRCKNFILQSLYLLQMWLIQASSKAGLYRVPILMTVASWMTDFVHWRGLCSCIFKRYHTCWC